MDVKIEAMKPSDWDQVRVIYEVGIATGNATYERTIPDWERWEPAHLAQARLVTKVDDRVVAWAALSLVSTRNVYAGVAEVSLYVGKEFRGIGIGDALLAALVDTSEKAGFWTLQSVIFPENTISIKLREKHGFRVVGIREKLGKMTFGAMQGKWRDVVLVERRSQVVGID